MDSRATQVNESIEQEFLSVIREYERVIYKVCYLYTTPTATLNDLYQDVVLNLWKAFPKFRRECKISTWIYRIALNTCISFIRKEKNVPEFVTLNREGDWMTEENDPLQEMLRQLYRMINQLGQPSYCFISRTKVMTKYQKLPA
jgi:RNA polymerase sigma-70 factor (ECF subfamily)